MGKHTRLLPEQLLTILSLSKDATAIYTGEDIQIQLANDAMLQLWEKQRDIVGLTLGQAMPELADQPFLEILKEVWNTGITYEAKNTIAHIIKNGKSQTFYFDFIYRAILNDDGTTYCILHTATDVTDSVKAWKIVEEKEKREQQIKEELTAINEEYHSTNEELLALNERYLAVNEKLNSSHEQLLSTSTELGNANKLLQEYNNVLNSENIILSDSEKKALSLLTDAPVAIAVLNGENLVIESANTQMLYLWGKTKDVIGNTLGTALPELIGQPFLQILNDVFTTGQPHYGNEVKATLEHNGELLDFYFNFVYQPLTDAGRTTQSIMVVAIDVTVQVNARKSVDELNVRLQIALEASGLGSTEVDLSTGTMQSTEQFKKIFGYARHEEFNYPDLFNAIFPEHRERVKTLIHAAILKKEAYEAEYPIRWRDGSVHWIQAHGRARYDDHGIANRMVGMTADITENKLAEQRKDDFLSIASHELKTPVTSLKASLQLLDRIKEKPLSAAHIQLIDQANRSMQKMSIMVDDLLNINRMTEGQFKLDKTIFDISGLLSVCCNHIRAEGKYELILESHEVLEIFADEHRIDQVIVNFVNNAVKYAPDSSKINLKAEKSDEWVKISVIDHGYGIKPEVLPYLFDRYYRVDHSGKSYTGLGLGLFICSEIIKQHGGEIGAESEIGKGSSFWFTLPLQSYWHNTQQNGN